MIDTEMLVTALKISGFSISCCALIMSVLQHRRSYTYVLLALLFLAFTMSYVFDISMLLLIEPTQTLSDYLMMMSFVVSFLIPPALLIYVRSLTGLPLFGAKKTVVWHLILPFLAILTAISFLTLAIEVRHNFLTPDRQVITSWGQEAYTLIAFFILPFAFYTQCIVYTALTFLTQIKHRKHLKDLFASTEAYEIRWITVMATWFGLFGFFNLLSYASQTSGVAFELSPVIDRLFDLVTVSMLAIWGLRQTPGMASNLAMQGDIQGHVKYEKSALDADRAARIARKLQTAMERDEVFRDPNLSLMSLSQHVGVSTNYVSQSLNEHLGVSFFDFVNGSRVEASKSMIIAGAKPISVIAYEVGFNSRSSFYTAFKKNTGMTPSEFGITGDATVAMIT